MAASSTPPSLPEWKRKLLLAKAQIKVSEEARKARCSCHQLRCEVCHPETPQWKRNLLGAQKEVLDFTKLRWDDEEPISSAPSYPSVIAAACRKHEEEDPELQWALQESLFDNPLQ